MTITVSNLNAGVLPASIGSIGDILPSFVAEQDAGNVVELLGDVTGSGVEVIQTAIGLGAVTYAKMQNESASTLLGNPSIASTSPSEITLGSGLVFSNSAVVIDTSFLRNYLSGLMLSNDSTTPNSVLDIAAGVCVDSTNSVMIKLGAFKKSTAGTWVAGTTNNGMGTGLTITASTWYHVFAIINAGVSDVYFDTSVTAANAPVGTTAFRRLGSFHANGSANIWIFTQNGNYFYTAANSIFGPTGSTVALALTGTITPPGVIIQPLLLIELSATGPSSEAIAGIGPAANSVLALNAFSITNNCTGDIITTTPYQGPPTNTSSQIYVSSTATGICSIQILSIGWIDSLGRNS